MFFSVNQETAIHSLASIVAGEGIMKLIDRTGERYERLTVEERLPAKSKTDTNARWICRCDCGRPVIAYGQDLARGKVKSCGCLNAERIMQHGMAHLPVYHVWQAMKQRCENPKAQRYKDYGGRGIKVCERWQRFENFIEDMGHPSPGKTLDRRDVDKGYEKENCRWVGNVTQANNKRNNRAITFGGETKTLAEWAWEIGIDWFTLRNRLDNLGWSVEKALTTPSLTARRYEVDGRKLTLIEWSVRYDIPLDTLRSRLNKLGWSAEDAIKTPAGPYVRKELN